VKAFSPELLRIGIWNGKQERKKAKERRGRKKTGNGIISL